MRWRPRGKHLNGVTIVCNISGKFPHYKVPITVAKNTELITIMKLYAIAYDPT